MTRKMKRRTLLATGAAVAGGVIVGTTLQRSSTSTPSSQVPTTPAMPERVLGNTGLRLPILGLGGAGQTPLSWNGAEKEAIALIQHALQLGVRYFDTAASYGPSEDYLGKVLPAHRQAVFLASKTAQRDRDGAWREFERSLKRLNTDSLDLWQLHHVATEQDLKTIFAKNGAIQALEEAKQQKLVRFSGITGHHEPTIIAEGLRRYPFDTILVPLNAADKHHPRPFAPVVLPLARQKGVGVIAMKVPAYGRLFKLGVLEGMHQAMGYSLSLAGVHCCVIAAETVDQLKHNVSVAQAFQPLNQQAMAGIEQHTAAVWEDNNFFRTWT